MSLLRTIQGYFLQEPEAEYEYLGASLLDVRLIITNSLVELFSSSLLPLHQGVMLLLLKSNFTLKLEHALKKKKLSKLIHSLCLV